MTDNDNLELKKRSRRRLVGAGALALVAAIILPMVMDEEPNVMVQDIQVSIPDRGADSRPIGRAPPAPDTLVLPQPREPLGEFAEVEPEPPAAVSEPDVAIVQPPASSSSAKASGSEAAKAARGVKNEGAQDEAARAAAILEGKRVATAAPEQSFVVQVGAFGESNKADAMRRDLDERGFASFTEGAGAVTRVRVGPYTSRGEAEKVAERLRSLGIGGVVTRR